MSSARDIWILLWLIGCATLANAALSLCQNGTVTASSGAMDDGTAVGQNYANRLFCERLIVAPAGQCIVVTITRFETESAFDFLTFYDGPNATADATVARLSGTLISLPYVLRSTKNALVVRFTSDASKTFDGFEFSWVFAAGALGMQWSLVTANASFGPIELMPLVVLNNELVLITTDAQAQVWSSADGGAQWRLLASNVFSQRFGPSSVVYNGVIWVIGGQGEDYLRDVYYSWNGVDWTKDPNLVPFFGREAHSSVVYNGSIWILGGWGAGNFAIDVWNASVPFGAGGLHWSLATSNYGFAPRCCHGHVVHRDQMFVIGGMTWGPTATNDVWRSSNGREWTVAMATAPFSVRCHISVVVYLNRIWVIGGGIPHLASAQDVWSSLDGANWIVGPTETPFGPRWAYRAVVLQGRILLVGGSNATGEDVADVWALQEPAFENPPLSVCDNDTITASTGIMNDGTPAGQTYANRLFCERLIVAPAGQCIMVTITRFETESAFDFLTFYDGPNTVARLSGTLNSLPYVLRSTKNELLVRFTSDASITFEGFEFSWVFAGHCTATPTTTPTPTRARTHTISKSSSLSSTTSLTLTPSLSVSASGSHSTSPSDTPRLSPTPTPSPTPTGSYSASSSPTPSVSPTFSSSPTASLTSSAESSRSPSPSASHSTVTTLSDTKTPSRSGTMSETTTNMPHLVDVDCVGHWKTMGQCSVTCGSGTISSTYEVLTPAANAGKPCETALGSIRTSACALSVCEPTQDCRGVFVTTSPCNAECDGGQLIETFLVVTKPSGNGTPCEFATGYTRTQPCNTDACGFNFKALVGFVRQHLWFVVACGLVLLIMVILACWCCRCRRKRRDRGTRTSRASSPPEPQPSCPLNVLVTTTAPRAPPLPHHAHHGSQTFTAVDLPDVELDMKEVHPLDSQTTCGNALRSLFVAYPPQLNDKKHNADDLA